MSRHLYRAEPAWPIASVGCKLSAVDPAVRELSPEQIAVLERLRSCGFTFVAFPLYASKIGVRKGNCAALLDPVYPEAEGRRVAGPDSVGASSGLRIFGDPCYMIEGNLSVLVTQGGARMFVWKKNQLPATPERLDELQRFAGELEELLATRV